MTSIQERVLGPFSLLLMSLLLFIVLVPSVSGERASALFLRIGFTTILLAGFYVALGRRSLRRFALPVVLFGITVEWLTYFFRLPAGPHIRLLLNAILFCLVAVVQLYAILSQRRVSADTVIGGINAYLLFAISFMLIHGLLALVAPGSYQTGGGTLAEHLLAGQRSESFSTMLYFSFVTITTLGYGDIVPVSGAAKLVASLEALFGQIYLATFIARLVALHVAGAAGGDEELRDSGDVVEN